MRIPEIPRPGLRDFEARKEKSRSVLFWCLHVAGRQEIEFFCDCSVYRALRPAVFLYLDG